MSLFRTAPTPRAVPAAAPVAPPKADLRLQHLFRGTLGTGHIHPLYMPMLKYRSERGAE